MLEYKIIFSNILFYLFGHHYIYFKNLKLIQEHAIAETLMDHMAKHLMPIVITILYIPKAIILVVAFQRIVSLK